MKPEYDAVSCLVSAWRWIENARESVALSIFAPPTWEHPMHDYAKSDYYWREHHARFARFVKARKLICQECGGAGGEIEPILDDGSGPWEQCGFCEGTGYVTPHLRGWWLRWKREERQRRTPLVKY